jgi:hypothetical protein
MPSVALLLLLQEEMYSFVSVAGEQSFKGKGTTVVQDS